MTYGDGRPSLDAAKLNSVAIGFGSGRRRIDRLRQLAHDCNLSDSEARAFGKLTKTSTWEALLTKHGLEFERKSEPLDTALSSQESKHSINLVDWIDWTQALALAMASVGLALLIFGLFPRYVSLPQVKITIQVGK